MDSQPPRSRSEPFDRSAPRGIVEGRTRGAVAQLVERIHGMDEARGSIPLSSTVTLPPAAVQAPRRLVPMRTHHGSPEVTVGVMFGHEPEPFAPEDPMIRMLISIAMHLGANFVGLLIADLVLDDLSIQWEVYIFAVAFFTLVEVIARPADHEDGDHERAGAARGHRPRHDVGRPDLHRPHLRRVQHHRCLDLGRGDRHRVARRGAGGHRPAVDLPPQRHRRRRPEGTGSGRRAAPGRRETVHSQLPAEAQPAPRLGWFDRGHAEPPT